MPVVNFIDACTDDQVSEVKRMIAEGVDINARSNGRTGLYEAMCHNNIEIMKILLACRDIQLGMPDSDLGWTGLHVACRMNNLDSVKLFLAHPACTKEVVNMESSDRVTAEMVAKNWGNHACAKALREYLDKPVPVPSPPPYAAIDSPSAICSLEVPIQMMAERLCLATVGSPDIEQDSMQRMTLGQIVGGIDQLSAFERTMKVTKKNLKNQHKQELEKLEAENKIFMGKKVELEKELSQRLCPSVQPAPDFTPSAPPAYQM